MLCLLGLFLIKVCEYLIVEPRLEQLAELHSLPIKVNITRSSHNLTSSHPHLTISHPHSLSYLCSQSPKVSHPRCDACRAMAGLFDSLFREEDSKIEHLGLELSLAEVGDIVKTVCSKDVFR